MAFNFPDPTLQQTVTNEDTGVTYQWKEPPGKWVVVTRPAEDSGVDALTDRVSAVEATTNDNTNEISNVKNRVSALEIDNRAIKSDVQSHEVAIQTLQSKPDVNLDNYYTKQEIDNQFALRGVGLIYLISNFNGTAASRPGEYNTDNRIFGQITKISLAPVDEQGKNARQAAIGDTIELYDQTVEKYYRYQITAVIIPGSYSVSYVGLEGDRDDTMGIGNPFLIYLYPTHISAAQVNGAITTLTETQSALAVEVDHNEEQLQAMSTAVFIAQSKINSLENLDIQNALSALASALQDIIELKSKVSSLEQKVFLILE